MRAISLAVAGCLVLGCSRPLTIPAHVVAVDAAPRAATTPAAAPDQWLLAHIDVETTGLVPGYHEMIDLGIVYTDLDGRVRDSLFIRVMPDHPERISKGARRVNGFDVARWRRGTGSSRSTFTRYWSSWSSAANRGSTSWPGPAGSQPLNISPRASHSLGKNLWLTVLAR